MRTTIPGFARRATALAAFVAICGAIFLALFNLAGGIDFGDRYRFTAVVPTALQLAQNAEVKRAGVTIGKVEEISNRGATAVLKLAIKREASPVRRDASVRIRAKTLVGENYVELDPGRASSPRLPDGGELPLAQAKPSVQLDQILSELPAARRERLRRLLDGMSQGVGDARVVNRFFGAGSDGIMAAASLGDALAVEREALAGLVEDSATIFRAVGDRRLAIQRLVAGAHDAAGAISAEERALAAGLRALPGALTQTGATAARLGEVGDRAGPVLDDLTAALSDLTPVMRELPPASRQTLSALRRLTAAAPATRGLLVSLREASPALTRAIGPLDALLRDLRPALRYLEPYSKDIAGFFGALGQGVAAKDATGHMARLKPTLTNSSLTLLGEEERKTLERLDTLGLIRLVNLRGTNAYPQPGTLAAPKPLSGSYPRIEREDP